MNRFWSVLELLALAAITGGVSMWSIPAALIVGGVLVLALSWAVNHR